MVIARVIERRFDALADEAVEAIVGRIPGYSGASQATAADIRRHVLAHYRAFVAALDSGEPASREDLSFIREYAARRVGEVSVGDFVSAFVLAQGLLWRAIRDLPRQSRTAQLASADALLQYFEVAISHAAEVYLEHVNLTAAADERSRRDVLSDLLAGRSLRPGRLSHAAEAHGLAADTPALVLCAATADGSADPLVLRAASGALAEAVHTDEPPLEVVRHDEIVVVANVASSPRDLGARVTGAHRRLAARGIRLVVGGSVVTYALRGLPAAYDEALLARARAAESGGVLVLADLSAFDYLTLHRDDTARRLVDDRVRDFVREDIASGRPLLGTLEAYLACDLNVRRAAEQLHIHVNTAHYRMERIAARTGLDLRRLADLMELVVAVRLGETAE
jgi:sugar diacid utilization regulator